MFFCSISIIQLKKIWCENKCAKIFNLIKNLFKFPLNYFNYTSNNEQYKYI